MEDRHHILHDALSWNKRMESSWLRNNPGFIVPMERPLHEELHRECPIVPVLGFHALQRVTRTFQPTGYVMDDLDGLRFSIEKAARHPKAHPLEKKLAMLTIESIGLQLPYIEESLSEKRHIA